MALSPRERDGVRKLGGRPKDPRRAMRELGLAASARKGARAVFRLAIFVGFWLVLYLILRPQGPVLSTNLQAGDVSRETIVAEESFVVGAPERTEELRSEAARDVPPIYIVDRGVRQQILSQLDSIWRIGPSGEPRDVTGERRMEGLLSAGVLLTGTPQIVFRESLYGSAPARDALRSAMERVYGSDILDGTEGFQELQNSRYGTYAKYSAGELMSAMAPASFIAMASARAELHRDLSSAFPGDIYEATRIALVNIGNQMLQPTFRFMPRVTRDRRQAARDRVEMKEEQVQEGDVLVSEGEQITSSIKAKLDKYASVLKRPWYTAELGWVLVALAVVLALLGFIRKYHGSWYEDSRFLATLVCVFLLTLGIAMLFDHVAERIPEIFGHLYFAVPVAMVGLMWNILISGRMALFIVNLIAVCIVLKHAGDNGLLAMLLFVYYLCCGMVAIFSTRVIRKRSDLYKACGLVALVAFIMAAAIIGILNPFELDLRQNWRMHLIGLGWAIFSGVMAAMLAGFLLPALETLLGLTTDLKLLEWSRKNDLLRRLEEEAPATYQHTLTMCQLGESAADAIGANSLEVRVGTLYHDIGKMERPDYFAENQVTKEQRMKHSKLQPSMSAKIIRNHVKAGIEMARQYGLPPVLRDYIPQHHGNMLISYFYERALQSDQHDSVREEDFRYPGPKPQRPETAIVMLADAVEAVSRTLNTTNEGEIKQMVRQIINDRFVDDQFDECDLTLADLHTLGESFAKSVRNMMHRRIEYPKPSHDRAEGKAVPL